MIRLHGKPISGGSALGMAAVVRWTAGLAQLPPRILEEMALVARKGISEPIEVILVAEELQSAASLTIPGVRVVGIIAEKAVFGDVRVTCPALVEVEQAITRVPDDVLILIDADRGIALVDPDGAAVAAHQAEQDRISPRRRIYIGFEHETARTVDGRAIRVFGVTVNPAQIEQAAHGGADGIILFTSEMMEADADQKEQLLTLLRAAGGKPVTVVADLERISTPALLQAARAAETSLALPLFESADEVPAVEAFLAAAGRELSDTEIDWRPVKLAGVIAPDAEEPADDQELGVERLLIDLSGEWDVLAADRQAWLREWIVAASRVMAPVEVILPPGSLAAVPAMVAMGVSGVGVGPAEIGEAKQLIRDSESAQRQ